MSAFGKVGERDPATTPADRLDALHALAEEVRKFATWNIYDPTRVLAKLGELDAVERKLGFVR